MHKNIIVGLTGGIGCGKTEAAKIFKQLGCTVIYADEIAKILMNSSPSIKKKLLNIFGESIFKADGSIDRKGLADIIFYDKVAKDKLIRIIHPLVIKYLQRVILSFKQKNVSQIMIIEAALIYEAKIETLFDYIIVVDANHDNVVKRVMQRDSITRKKIVQRIKSQMQNKLKVSKADFVIKNNGTYDHLEANCKFLFKLFMKLIKPEIN